MSGNPFTNCLLLTFLLFPAALPLNAQKSEDSEAAKKGAVKAIASLDAFLKANTWEEAAKYVMDAEELKPRMKTHYALLPWKKPAVTSLRPIGGTKMPSEKPYYTYDFSLVVEGKPKPVPATVVQVGDAYLVDWEIFSQTMDDSFEKFRTDQGEQAMTFRMGVYRAYVFEEHKDLIKGGVVRMNGQWRPASMDRVEMFVGETSALGKAVAETLPWNEFLPCRVKVKWNKSGKTPFVELMGIETMDFSKPSVISGPNPKRFVN